MSRDKIIMSIMQFNKRIRLVTGLLSLPGLALFIWWCILTR